MFQPGQSGNPNGRPKGSKNKVTDQIREAYAMVLENKLPDLERLLNQVAHEDPAKAIELMLKLSNRFLPELNRTELTGADGDKLEIKFDFGTPSEPEEPTEE